MVASPSPMSRVFISRLLMTLILWGLVLWVAIDDSKYASDYSFLALVCTAVFYGTREFWRLRSHKSLPSLRLVAVISGAVVTGGLFHFSSMQKGDRTLGWDIAIIIAFLVIGLAVEVFKGLPPSTGPKFAHNFARVQGPQLALTFDDGPHAENTLKLLEVLAEYGVKATFFVVGEAAAAHPEILREVAAAGHEIGNHSWSHPNLTKLSRKEVRTEIERTQRVVRDATGQTPKVMRPPYGAFTEFQRRWAFKEFGLNLIFWSVDPLDWQQPSAPVIAQRILRDAGEGKIILSHDTQIQTVEAMPEVIKTLQNKGFEFVTVSELLALEKEAVAENAV